MQIHRLDLDFLSNETKARVLIDLESCLGANTLSVSQKVDMESQVHLLSNAICDDIGNDEVGRDFIDAIRSEVFRTNKQM